MLDKLTDVTLETVAGGALPELFAHAFERVLGNILDVNTDPEAKREVRLTLRIRPTANRESAAVEVECREVLAGVRPAGGMMFLGRDRDGSVRAVTQDLRQPDLFVDTDGVLPITAAKAQGES